MLQRSRSAAAVPVAATVADDLCEYHGHDDSLTGSAVELRQQIHGPVQVDTSARAKPERRCRRGKVLLEGFATVAAVRGHANCSTGVGAIATIESILCGIVGRTVQGVVPGAATQGVLADLAVKGVVADGACFHCLILPPAGRPTSGGAWCSCGRLLVAVRAEWDQTGWDY